MKKFGEFSDRTFNSTYASQYEDLARWLGRRDVTESFALCGGRAIGTLETLYQTVLNSV